MSLINRLPSGALDIVGDIHGEFEALVNLMTHLKYDNDGKHAEDRTLVFVGDFCDRGPDSPAVMQLIEKLVRAGRAVAILGNHEVNLLMGDPKDGSGWFFEERRKKDFSRYHPFNLATEDEKKRHIKFSIIFTNCFGTRGSTYHSCRLDTRKNKNSTRYRNF